MSNRRDKLPARLHPRPRLAQTDGMKFALLIAAALAALALWQGLRLLQARRTRQQAISRLLDAADSLEARLRAARSEIEAVAGDHENPVRAAMQDLLRQRLWLQEHAHSASIAQLDGVRDALQIASTRLDQQLQQLEQARNATP